MNTAKKMTGFALAATAAAMFAMAPMNVSAGSDKADCTNAGGNFAS